MFVYVFILLLGLFFVFLEFENISIVENNLENNTKIEKRWFFIFYSLILFSFLAFRYNTGYDYFNYKVIYYNIAKNINAIFDSRFEPGFNILVFFSKNIFKLNYSGFLFIIAILAFIPKYKFIGRFSIFPIFSLLIYFPGLFLGQDFGQFRQGIAIGFIFLSIPYIYERNFYKFLIFFTIAFSFHYSAIVFLPMYFLSTINITKKRFYIFLFLGIIFSFVDLSTIVSSVIRVVLNNNLGNYIDKLLKSNKADGTLIIFKSVSFWIRIFILFFIFYNREKLFKLNNLYELFFNIYFIGAIGYFVFFSIPLFSARMFNYFKYLDIIFLPMIVLCFKYKSIKVLYIIAMFLYCAYRVYNIINGQIESFLPYDYIFNWRRF